ncbi:lasso peptide biosynthesis B2 protein [Dyella sp. KULCS107]|uniref:lasso peptide biosynthesis B2 protein n=1 Tax=Dyella sp. KULCS107 TaxID=3422216 RepID=UPI003D6EE3DD
MIDLTTDISCCELDGRLFFLDIQNDRYFQISPALERSLLDYLRTPDDAAADISALSRLNLLPQTRSASRTAGAETISSPSESLSEAPALHRRIPLSAIRDVFVAVLTMRRQLQTQRLKSILQSLVDYRQRKSTSPANTNTEIAAGLKEAATNFNRVRPFVPIETSCLLDSLAMVRFLAAQGFSTRLVFAVACDPFSAHAWVQHGSLVLNETVGAAQAHCPIRVI